MVYTTPRKNENLYTPDIIFLNGVSYILDYPGLGEKRNSG